MLDDPPLIVRMRGLAGFMDDSLVILQSEQSQFRACGPVIRAALHMDGTRGMANPALLCPER